MALGWRAQEVLYRIAGEKAPTVTLTDEAAKRAAVADAWRGWWKDAAATTDLAKVNLDNALQGINVVCEIPANEQQGHVRAFRADGRVLWDIGNVPGPVDARLLPNGNVLVGEWHTSQVTECATAPARSSGLSRPAPCSPPASGCPTATPLSAPRAR